MPSKTKALAARQAAFPAVPKELVDQFCQGPMTANAVERRLPGVQEGADRACLGCRAGPPSGLPARGCQAGRGPRTTATAAPARRC